jgi:diaminopimelate decarboxylase
VLHDAARAESPAFRPGSASTEPQAGDQVLIGNAGAYTTCYSGRSTFNGYPAPVIRIMR